jgi:hypothetical protein
MVNTGLIKRYKVVDIVDLPGSEADGTLLVCLHKWRDREDFSPFCEAALMLDLE